MSSQPVTAWSPTLPTVAENPTDSLQFAESEAPQPLLEQTLSTRSSWESIPSNAEAPASIPQIAPALASTPTPATADDCVICKEPLNGPATVKPCGHIFDLGCICSWVIHKGSGRTLCPLCNGRMTEIQHYTTDSSSAEPQLRTISTGGAPDRPFGDDPGNPIIEAEAVLDLLGDVQDARGPRNLRADEAIEEGMNAREIHAAQERRRLRGLPVRSINLLIRPPLSDFWVRDGDMLVMVGERYNITIRQQDLLTISKLMTSLSLQFKHQDTFQSLPEYREDRQALETYARIANIINEQIQQHMSDSNTETVTIDAYKTEFGKDQRGIFSQLQRSTSIIRNAREEIPFRLRLRREIDLTEEGPANKDDDLEPLTLEDRTVDRMRREEYLRVARSDIQRIMRNATFADQGFELDRSTSNLLEPIQQRAERQDGIWWRGVNEVLNFRPFRGT